MSILVRAQAVWSNAVVTIVGDSESVVTDFGTAEKPVARSWTRYAVT